MSMLSTPMAAQPIEYIRVQIEDVEVEHRLVHARDRTNVLIQAVFNTQPGGLMVIPSQGEVWSAVRRGFTWYLDEKLDLSDATNDMTAGDLRLKAAKTVYIEGTGGFLNGRAYGATIRDYYYSSIAGWTSVVLTHDPAGIDTILPFLNGLAVVPELWTYDATSRTITFVATLGEIGSLLVTYQTWGVNRDDIATVVGKSYIRAIEEYIPA